MTTRVTLPPLTEKEWQAQVVHFARLRRWE